MADQIHYSVNQVGKLNPMARKAYEEERKQQKSTIIDNSQELADAKKAAADKAAADKADAKKAAADKAAAEKAASEKAASEKAASDAAKKAAEKAASEKAAADAVKKAAEKAASDKAAADAAKKAAEKAASDKAAADAVKKAADKAASDAAEQARKYAADSNALENNKQKLPITDEEKSWYDYVWPYAPYIFTGLVILGTGIYYNRNAIKSIMGFAASASASSGSGDSSSAPNSGLPDMSFISGAASSSDTSSSSVQDATPAVAAMALPVASLSSPSSRATSHAEEEEPSSINFPGRENTIVRARADLINQISALEAQLASQDVKTLSKKERSARKATEELIKKLHVNELNEEQATGFEEIFKKLQEGKITFKQANNELAKIKLTITAEDILDEGQEQASVSSPTEDRGQTIDEPPAIAKVQALSLPLPVSFMNSSMHVIPESSAASSPGSAFSMGSTVHVTHESVLFTPSSSGSSSSLVSPANFSPASSDQAQMLLEERMDLAKLAGKTHHAEEQ